MSRHTDCSLKRLIQNFTKSRVSMNHHTQLLHGSSSSHGIRTLLNQISSMDSNNVNRDNLSSLLVVQNFGNTISFQFRKCFGVGTEASLRLSESPSFLLGTFNSLLLGRSNHCDFRVGEASGRNGIVVDGVVSSANVFNGTDSLCRGGMSQHHFTVGVSDAPYVGYDFSVFVFGEDLHLFVDGDKSTLSFNTGLFESHVFGVGDTSSGNHGSIDFEGFDVFLGIGINHLDSNWLHPRNTRRNLTGKHSSPIINRPIPNQQPLGLLRNLPVKRGHNIRQCLNEGNFTPKGGVYVREFKTNVSRSNDGDPFWDGLEFECSVGGVDCLFVHSDSWGYEWDGSWC
mmetsp:Transcript_8902/g.19933  ORF Transcript_8902/g.19933 Transcript_8902/m.19933 type:complete len:341 (+) Transcript_8902:196-1218(+)